MPDWTLEGAGRTQPVSESFTVANQGGVLATAGAINTKGAWAVVSAATPFEAHGIFVCLSNKTVAADQLLDIGVGAAGAEQVLIPNLAHTGFNFKVYFFPARIAAGARLVVRNQSTTASVTNRVHIALLQQSFLGMPCFDRFVALGAVPATSRGTALANPAANVWGAWTQIAATAGVPLKWLMPAPGDQGILTRTSGQKFVHQAARGAAGVEQAVTPEVPFTSSATNFSITAGWGQYVDIPAGERISGRYASGAATTLGMDMIVYGGVG